MKQSLFLLSTLIITLIVAFALWWFFLGNPANFKDGESRQVPLNILGQVYTGGYIVPLLIMLTLMNFTIVFERAFSLNKAKGTAPLTTFLKSVQKNLQANKIDDAIKACDLQRGSAANIIRTGLDRFKVISGDRTLGSEKRMAEVQRAIEEATSLETPLLERNLVALSTIASIATMLGLLGTTIGMIRAFQALATAGAPDAIQLSIGISEALVNTALGLIAAIVGIMMYNFFTTRVDSFTYLIDEASYNVVQILNTQSE